MAVSVFADETMLLDGWEFSRGSETNSWEAVRIPHDWAISGPFGKPLIDSVGKEPIDPCVFCEAGEAYLWFGCRELFMARLTKDMTHIEGEISKVEIPDYAEAPFVFKRGELYYLMYSNGWAKDSTLVYATSSSPLGPWNYRGEVMPNQGCSTLHGSVVKFNGKWYLFYHDRSLSGNNYRRSAKWREITFARDGTIQAHELTPRVAP